jgi:hypothetical protein
MSQYYRPPQRQAYNWREREAEATRKAAEEEQRKKNVMNETNFPTLSTARPLEAPSGNKFAKLAEKWAVDAEVERRMDAHKKFQQAADRIQVVAPRSYTRSQYERYDDDYEEDLPPEASEHRSVLDDDVGWSEVRRKTPKPKRELTIEEMDERDRRLALEAEARADEFNGELFDSKRHDHDRV